MRGIGEAGAQRGIGQGLALGDQRRYHPHPMPLTETADRHADFFLEQVHQPRRRQVDVFGQLVHRIAVGEIFLHQLDHPLNAPIQQLLASFRPGRWDQPVKQLMNGTGVGLARPDIGECSQYLGLVLQPVQALPIAFAHGVVDRRVVLTFGLDKQDGHQRTANLNLMQAAGRNQCATAFPPATALAFQNPERPVNAHAQRRRPQPVFGNVRQAAHEKTAILPNVELAQGIASP